MSRQSEKATRLLQVTPGNIRNNHLYISGHYDFFPAESVGPARKRKGQAGGTEIEIVLEGLNETVTTDIGTNAKTGKPRNFFRGRKWVRRFFEHHKIDAGDTLALKRIGSRKYRLTPQTNDNEPSPPRVF